MLFWLILAFHASLHFVFAPSGPKRKHQSLVSALVCQVTEHCEFDRAEVGFNSFLPGPRLQGVLRLRSPFLRDLQRHDVLQSGEVLCGSQVIALPFPVFGQLDQLEQPFPFHSHSISFPWHPMAFRCTSHALPFSIIFPYCPGFLLEGPHGSAGPIAHHCLTSLEIQQTLLAFWFHVFMPCLRE